MSARPTLGASLEEAAASLRAGEITSEDLTAATVDGLEGLGRRLNALVSCHRDEALKAASLCDEARDAGGNLPPLHGIPLAHKDLYLRAGWAVAAGSRLLEGVAAEETAEVCRRLDKAGALDCGRLNTVEFGLGTTGHNEITGPVHNPWNPDFITGGSSSGSAAAVAAGLVPAALGSDTGGSVRLPAAACGLVGLKPTFGLVGRSGVLPLAHSLDTVGPLTRSVRDCALMLQAIAGPDAEDPACQERPVPDYLAAIEEGAAGLRIGVPRSYMDGAVDDDVSSAFQTAESARASLKLAARDVTVEGIEMSNRVTTLLIAVEGSAVHSRWLETRAWDYGSQTLSRLMSGLFVPAEAYVRALEYRQRFLRQTLEGVFREVDVLLTPMWPFRLPTIAESDLGDNPDFSAMVMASGHFSRPFNLLGLPAITLPCGRCSRGLPIGFQLVARPFEEALLLRTARAFEKALDLPDDRPGLSVWRQAA
ncbi:MAG: amidase [Pseudomonadota bacterium]